MVFLFSFSLEVLVTDNIETFQVEEQLNKQLSQAYASNLDLY